MDTLDLPSISASITPPSFPAVSKPVEQPITLPDTSTLPPSTQLDNITLPSASNVPTIDLFEPVLSMPTKPQPLNVAGPGAAPSYVNPRLPPAPTFTVPSAPSFTTIPLPPEPTFTIPTFDEAAPADTLTNPYVEFNYTEHLYSSALLTSLSTKLETELLNRTTGIELDETDLWQRGREREQLGGDALISSTQRYMNAVGGLLPTDAQLALGDSSKQRAYLDKATFERDRWLKHNDMAVSHRQYQIEKAVGLEEQSQGHYNKMKERTLLVAKATVDYALQVFDAQVTKFKTQLEKYKVGAQVFESRIRGANAVLELYKTRVEAARLTVEMQRLYAEVYNIQLSGVQSLVSIYKTRMEAARISANIERLKLEGFKASIDAYAAQVNAKTVEVKLYEAMLRGETAKADVYTSTVEAYKAKVDAYRTSYQAKGIVVNAEIAAAELRLDKCKTDITRYLEELETTKARIKISAEKYRDEIRQYAAETEIESARAQAMADYYEVYGHASVAIAKIYKDYALGMGEVRIQAAQIKSQEAIALSKIANNEKIAIARIASGEVIAKAHNSSSERIAISHNSTQEMINAGHVSTNEQAVLSHIFTAHRVGLMHLQASEYAAVTSLVGSENTALTHANIAIARANAEGQLAALELTASVI